MAKIESELSKRRQGRRNVHDFPEEPYDFTRVDLYYPSARVRLVKDLWGMWEFEVRLRSRCRQPFDMDFIRALCRSMARPYRQGKSPRAKALVRACDKALRTIGAFSRGNNYDAWHSKLLQEVRAAFDANAKLREPSDIYGRMASDKKRNERQQRKRHT